MEIVAMFAQEGAELLTVLSAELSQQCASRIGMIHAPKRFLVAQAFTGCAVIGAKPCVRLHRRCVRVEGKDMREDRPRTFIAGIAMNAIKNGSSVLSSE